MSNTCEFCKKEFASKSGLNAHLKRAQYCIKKRDATDVKLFICTGCKKQFASKQNSNIHMESCVPYQIKIESEKYIKQIDELTKKIQEIHEQYQKQIEEERKQHKEHTQQFEKITMKAISIPKTSISHSKSQTNILIQKLDKLTPEHMQEQVPNLTIQHVKNGAYGYAEYALKFVFCNRLLCVDPSRLKFKYKNEKGRAVTDLLLGKLSKMFFISIKTRNLELLNEVNDLWSKYEPSVYSQLMDPIRRGYELVNNGANGLPSELYNDFVKSVCNNTIIITGDPTESPEIIQVCDDNIELQLEDE